MSMFTSKAPREKRYSIRSKN